MRVRITTSASGSKVARVNTCVYTVRTSNAVRIRSGAKVLKPWYGCVVPETSTVADVFTDFSSGAIERAGSGNAIPDEYRTAFVEARVGKTN